MHYFIYATKDSWISSGSNAGTTGVSEKDQNYGQDPILEIKKVFYNSSFDYQTRALVQFDVTEISKSVSDGSITSPKYFLRLYEAEGNQELSTEYKLAAYPLSQSWDEGTGKWGDNPKVTNGVSWENRSFKPNFTAVTWSKYDGSQQHGGAYISSSGYQASQSFSYSSPDVNMDVTDIVNNWITGSDADTYIPNNGFVLRFSGSQEIITGSEEHIFGNLKFFSSQTHTIYTPKLEVKWDDSVPATGDNTGSLIEFDVTGASDNYLYMTGLREKYRENEKVKFRVGARKRYVQKTFSTSVNTLSGSYIPATSGSYSILDINTNDTIIPFSDYTKLSCDSTSNYFIQWMNTFQTNRIYKIIYKVKYNDGQEVIFDNNFEFKVTG